MKSLGRSRLSIILVAAAALLPMIWAARTWAQAPAELDSETMLSLVVPPQADGARVGVHMWARADQARGPGGLPTVFVVTLYTKHGASGPEEREIINYLQYSGGAWAPARPRDDGTLLTDEWAWISLNLHNLSASASGQGDSSQYTVDYDANGTFNGTQRQLSVEEVYAADLSLASTTVLMDSANPNAAPGAPVASARPSVRPAATTSATVRPAASSSPSSSRPPAPSATVVSSGPNRILPASPTP